MDVYFGTVDGSLPIFVPGKYADAPEIKGDSGVSLDVFPGLEVHRLVLMSPEDFAISSDAPGSAFSIKYKCENSDHDHYGTVRYSLVVHGELDSFDLTEEEANSMIDGLLLVFPELNEDTVE